MIIVRSPKIHLSIIASGDVSAEDVGQGTYGVIWVRDHLGVLPDVWYFLLHDYHHV